ncbi:MAG: DUF1828 domain-containing protein [Selenomonas artemidis]|uniref:DUF1828 domain-containing protein n=1 Tax=Selenomonas sp. F0473 TaxID=999423 RepID=UPI00029DE6C4|nr:DUF1828 domain-containing protein [Selenomonas sp. F0473]EKU71222.1 hypothetical protein HMPREF9161_01316 [Selenomonas sp. F0473]
MSNSVLADNYYNWLRENTLEEELPNGWVVMGTPFVDRHNDGLTIYIKRDMGDFVLSDDGYIISDLTSDGISLNSPKRKNMMDKILQGYGVSNKSGELTIRASKENLPQKKHMLIQAMLSLNDMFMVSSKNVKSVFLEDVARFFDENNIVNIQDVSITGASGFSFKIDFVIPAIKAKRKPERMIRVFNAPREDRIKSLLFEWGDVKKQRRRDTELVTILNDEKRIDDKIVYALNQYETQFILWSKRGEAVSDLSAA